MYVRVCVCVCVRVCAQYWLQAHMRRSSGEYLAQSHELLRHKGHSYTVTLSC